MRLLLFNPNGSAHITERMAASARRVLAPGETMRAVTARHGPPAVRDTATLALAEDGARRELPGPMAEADALLLAISLDGLAGPLRSQFAPKPVRGMTEAAVAVAARQALRIGLLTLGSGLRPLYEARLAALAPADRIAGVEAPDLPQAFDAGPMVDPALLDPLAAAARRLRGQGAGAIVLAGAVLCGYDQALQAVAGVPVLDGVACAVLELRAALAGDAGAGVPAPK